MHSKKFDGTSVPSDPGKGAAHRGGDDMVGLVRRGGGGENPEK
jgi:hypothetical protein